MTALPHRPARLTLVAAVAALAPAWSACAQVEQKDLDAAAAQFADKKYAEAAAAYDKLASALGPDRPQLKPTLTFNRGCAQLAAGDAASAEKSFLEVDAAAADRPLRAAARYNLGQIACKQAEPQVAKEPAAAIEAYRRAERHFRNALADQPDNTDAARNIEIVQRKIAKLIEDQKKQEEQQKDQKQGQDDQKDPKDQGQSPPDQQKQDQHKQDQDKQDQQKQDKQQQGDQKQGSQPKPSDQGQQDEQSQQPQQDKDDPNGQKSPKPESQPDKKPEPGEDGRENKEQSSAEQPEQQAGGKPLDHREFDLTAAQILDKEKQHRERLKQLLKIMRARAAPVEKDW